MAMCEEVCWVSVVIATSPSWLANKNTDVELLEEDEKDDGGGGKNERIWI